MKKLRIYLDTSVIGGCFDEKFSVASLKLMECIHVGMYKAMLSQVTFDELLDAPEQVRAVLNDFGSEEVSIIPTTREVDEMGYRRIEIRSPEELIYGKES